MSDRDGITSVCPYWRIRDNHRITCEGLIEGTSVTWHFRTAADTLQQDEIFCRKHWKRCEMALCIERFRNFDDG